MGRVGGPRIVAHTLSYPPGRRIGAELATHGLLSYLAGSGWTSVVVPQTEPGAHPACVDGVHRVGSLLAAGTRPDLVLTHIPLIESARRLATRTGAPLILTAHGGASGWLASHVRLADPALVLANGLDMQTGLARADRPVHVLRPPVWPEDHLVAPFGEEGDGAAITLVNASRDKGGAVVAEMARRLPNLPFLVVEGGYGQTVDILRARPNVTVIPHDSMSMRDVWDRTRLLLMPSLEESWGMVAVEAMINGIPVIGSTSAGLGEALGPAMPKIPRENLGQWEREIGRAYDGPRWDELHIAALRRAAELHPAGDLRMTERRLSSLINREVPMGTLRYRNVRTGQVVDVEEGSRLHHRIAGAPLVWHPVPDVAPPVATGAGAPGHLVTEDARAGAADPVAYDPPALPEPPPRSASKAEWVEYAVRRGSDQSAATKATKTALVALFG